MDIQSFFNQLQTVSHDATSIVNRQLLISQGESLEQSIHQFSQELARVDADVNRRLTDYVSTVNITAESLAQINAQVIAAGDNASSDLLDQRDRLLTSLSELIDINTHTSPDGSLNVLVANGRPLVLGTQSFELQTVADEFNPSRLQIAHVVGTRTDNISRQITGGELGGLLSFRQEALDPAKRNLGLVAFGLTESFNRQHAQGVDLNGNLGGNFFRSIPGVVTASSGNAGAGSVSVTIADATAVQPRDYLLRFDGATWQATDSGSGALLTMSGSGTGIDPFVIDGLELVVTPGAVADDQFLVRAVSEAAVGFQMELSDPAAIAAANPVTTSVAFSNIGDADVSVAQIDDSSNPALRQAVNIVFDDPTTYRIFDGGGTDLTGPQAFTSGADIVFNGWRVSISGSPVGGDSFGVEPTLSGSGDNGNVVELTGIRSRGFLDGGQTSVDDTIGNLVASVGGAALRSAQSLSAQTVLRQQLELDVQNVSGVNLDEEAVNALRYQEAYLASSRLIKMADDLFLSVLNMIGRG